MSRARGAQGGPLYVSPNIQYDDPICVRLAYIRYPIGQSDLAEFLSDLIPYTLFEAERKNWRFEIGAVKLLTGRRLEERTDMATEQSIAAYFERGYTEHSGGILGVWRLYQLLAISVLWAWTQRDPTAPFFYCQILAWQVERIYRESNRLEFTDRGLRSSVSHSDATRLPLEQMQKYFNRHHFLGWRSWIAVGEPPSVARLSKELYEIIGTAGTNLDQCPNCGRVFFKGDTRKKFCGHYCRTIFSRKKMRETQADTDEGKRTM